MYGKDKYNHPPLYGPIDLGQQKKKRGVKYTKIILFKKKRGYTKPMAGVSQLKSKWPPYNRTIFVCCIYNSTRFIWISLGIITCDICAKLRFECFVYYFTTIVIRLGDEN